MTENTSILDVAEVTNKILFDLNFEEYDTIKKVEFTKSIIDELNNNVENYYKEMLLSHTCTFDEMCKYITDDTYELIRKSYYPTGEITSNLIADILFRYHGLYRFNHNDKFLFPYKINETICEYLTNKNRSYAWDRFELNPYYEETQYYTLDSQKTIPFMKGEYTLDTKNNELVFTAFNGLLYTIIINKDNIINRVKLARIGNEKIK